MPATAKSLRDNVYAAGGARDPAELYTAFRGRLPTPDALARAARVERGSRRSRSVWFIAAVRRSRSRSGGGSRPRRVMLVHGPPHGRTSPGRRLRAASRRRRGRACDLAEGGNALEAMVAMAATIAAVYPHMNHRRRRRLLAGARAVRPRARDHGAPGRAGANARRRALSRVRDDPAARAARRAHRAGRGRRLDCWRWKLRRPMAGACRSPMLLAPAIRHAREGYVVTRSQARLTAEKLAELKDVPGFARDFPGRRQAARRRQDAQADRARRDARSSRPCRARRFLSRRRRPRDRRRSRARRQPGDARRPRALPRRRSPSRCRSRSKPAPLYNTPPPTQGLASLMILALFERLRRHRGRRLRSRPRPGRGDQARVPRARPRGHRSRSAAASAPSAISTPSFSTPRRARSIGARPRLGRRRRARATPSGWARPTLRARRLLHPVALLGVRLRRRAAAHRRADAEPRRELLARSEAR